MHVLYVGYCLSVPNEQLCLLRTPAISTLSLCIVYRRVCMRRFHYLNLSCFGRG